MTTKQAKAITKLLESIDINIYPDKLKELETVCEVEKILVS